MNSERISCKYCTSSGIDLGLITTLRRSRAAGCCRYSWGFCQGSAFIVEFLRCCLFEWVRLNPQVRTMICSQKSTYAGEMIAPCPAPKTPALRQPFAEGDTHAPKAPTMRRRRQQCAEGARRRQLCNTHAPKAPTIRRRRQKAPTKAKTMRRRRQQCAEGARRHQLCAQGASLAPKASALRRRRHPCAEGANNAPKAPTVRRRRQKAPTMR